MAWSNTIKAKVCADMQCLHVNFQQTLQVLLKSTHVCMQCCVCIECVQNIIVKEAQRIMGQDSQKRLLLHPGI